MPSVDPARGPVYHPPVPSSPSTSGSGMPPRSDAPGGDHSPVPPGDSLGGPPPPRGGYPYGPPHPSYGLPSGYGDKLGGPPPPGAYNGSAGGQYGPPPPHRGPPPPYSAGGYPPYAYGRPPPWAGMYDGGAYMGGYGVPPQHGMGGGGGGAGAPQRSAMSMPPKGSNRGLPQASGRGGPSPYPPSSKGKEDDDSSSPPKDPSAVGSSMHHPHQMPRITSPVSKPLMISQQEMAENLEDLERVKAQAAAELSLAEVKPIQTDYHFFVQDTKDKLRQLTIAEVDKSLQGHDQEFISKNRRFFINSNLNGRFMKEWEDLSREDREVYFQKEEEDRRRFMEDDEVASRHCFTLTARIRSPIKSSKPEQEQQKKSAAAREKENEQEERNTTMVQQEQQLTMVGGEHDLPTPPPDEEDSPGKRAASDEDGGSPSKKNRSDEDTLAMYASHATSV